MESMLIVAVALIGLFLPAYLTKRRIGVLGLALCAGYLLSTSWASTLTPFVASQGISVNWPPLSSIVAITLTLLPAALLFLSSPSYHQMLPRVAGSAMFAVLGLAFILDSLRPLFLTMDGGFDLYTNLNNFKDLVIIAGVAVSIGDMLFTKYGGGKHAKGKSAH